MEVLPVAYTTFVSSVHKSLIEHILYKGFAFWQTPYLMSVTWIMWSVLVIAFQNSFYSVALARFLVIAI